MSDNEETARVLRMTNWPPLGAGEPVTVIVEEDSLEGTVEESVAHMLEASAGTFVAVDVFESGAGVAAHLAGAARAAAARDDERNAAILYYWAAAHLPLLAEHGVLMTRDPAPLSADEVRDVLLQLSRHPAYRGQRVVVAAADGTIVTLSEGEVSG